jgi:hypothetical protein
VSAAARLHAARMGLEAVQKLAAERADGPILALVTLALAASSESDSDARRRKADAERKRTARGRPPDVHTDGARTAGGHEGGVGGGVSGDRDPRGEEIPTSPTGGGPGEGRQEVLRMSARNVTSDGCFGMAVSSWQDGLRTATGRGVTALSVGETRKLLDAFDAHAPKGPAREAWAREAGVSYGMYSSGTESSVWGFARWLDAGRPPERGSGTRPLSRVQSAPPGGGNYKIGDGQ